MLGYINVNSSDPDIQRLDSNVDRVFDSIFPNPLLANPTIISDLIFTSGTDLVINHKLGRVVKGYLPIKSSAAASIYTSSTSLINPLTQIILKSNANATVSLLFF